MYISSANQAALRARYRLTALIVVALGISTVLYVVIGWAFAPAMPRVNYQWLVNSNYAIAGLVAVLALGGVFLRRFFLSPTRLQKAGKQSLSALLSRLYLCSLVGAVLGDVVGILGVVASLVTGNREYSWRLGIAALLMIAYSFPRHGEWSRAVAGLELQNSPSIGGTAAAEQIKLRLNELE